MNIIDIEKESRYDVDPVVGLIVMQDTSSEELATLMHAFIGKGIPEDSVHTIFFKEFNVGILKVEPNSAICCGKKTLITEINQIVESFYRTYICLWPDEYHESYCFLKEDQSIWFRSTTPDETAIDVTVEFYVPDTSEPVDLITVRFVRDIPGEEESKS